DCASPSANAASAAARITNDFMCYPLTHERTAASRVASHARLCIRHVLLQNLLPQPPRNRACRIVHSVMDQPRTCVVGVMLEPSSCGTESKRIAPGIHVAPHAVTANTVELVRQENLQIANRVLFGEITAGIAKERAPPLPIHANDMSGLMENGMNGRVGAPIDLVEDQSRFAIAPVRAPDRFTKWLLAAAQRVLGEQLVDHLPRQLTCTQDVMSLSHLECRVAPLLMDSFSSFRA